MCYYPDNLIKVICFRKKYFFYDVIFVLGFFWTLDFAKKAILLFFLHEQRFQFVASGFIFPAKLNWVLRLNAASKRSLVLVPFRELF
jgi:hypothetical protein